MQTSGIAQRLQMNKVSQAQRIQNVIDHNAFVDVAYVTKVDEEKRIVTCTNDTATYQDVEVLSVGGNGIRLDVMPKKDDAVLVLTPRIPIKDTSTFKRQSYYITAYNTFCTKCIPLGSRYTEDKDCVKVSKSEGKISLSVTTDTDVEITAKSITLNGANGKLEIT